LAPDHRGEEASVIGLSWDAVRLSLHVLAATIWVGGQLVLASLVPVLRRAGADTVRLAARRFNAVAWPAFGVLVLTGIWNVAAERHHLHGAYRTTLVVKLVVVALSGLAAVLHLRAGGSAARGIWGAATAITALAALVLGILLSG
jgi:putative copper export protein